MQLGLSASAVACVLHYVLPALASNYVLQILVVEAPMLGMKRITTYSYVGAGGADNAAERKRVSIKDELWRVANSTWVAFPGQHSSSDSVRTLSSTARTL